MLLTWDERYDTKTYQKLLLRAVETHLGPVGKRGLEREVITFLAVHRRRMQRRGPAAREPQPREVPNDSNASKSRIQI
jgi:hypothetical protein